MNRDILYQHFARIGHAFSNPHRLRILNLLCQAEKSVDSIAAAIGQSLAATSAHLKVLRSACLVEARKEGRNVFYRPSDDGVGALLLTLRRTGERILPEVREVARDFVQDKDAMAQLSGDELIKKVRAGLVTLIDLRPVDEFDTAHFPGARSVPLADLEGFLRSAPKRRPIVAYCRGPYCLVAVTSVNKMRERGLNAKRFPMGVLDWRDAGFPLERQVPTDLNK